MSIDYASIARRTTRILFAAQSLGSAGFIAASTINSIVGAKLSGQAAWAGVPASVYQIGGAFAAFGWGYGMDRLGRRGGLTLGLIFGVLGAGVAGYALIAQSFGIFLAGMVLMGTANSAVQLGRFAAAEVNPPSQRGRAISNVVIGGTMGAIFGPLMVGPMGDWSKSLGIDELSGPYVASLILFAIAALVIWLWLRPDPRDVGREVAQLYPETTSENGARSIPMILRQPATMVAMSSMVIGQLTMVMLMVITSLHMKDHHHALGDISFVISSHTFGMFAFSILSGRLADRIGRAPVIVIGAVTLILACLTAPLSPDVLPISVALFLLGLGWNFCYVGGSTLLADQLSPSERARTQGFNDLMIGLTSGLGSLMSGFIFAALGYATVGVVSALVTVIPIALTLWWSMGRRAALQKASVQN
ncbi:MAG: MFS transporter [Chloroflexi bacterium]|nr:MFS transporter [Chloroflexota bacterium]